MKQLKLNIGCEEKIVNKKIKEEFSLKNATLYGGYNLFSDYLASNGLDRLLEEELGGMKAPWATSPPDQRAGRKHAMIFPLIIFPHRVSTLMLQTWNCGFWP